LEAIIKDYCEQAEGDPDVFDVVQKACNVVTKYNEAPLGRDPYAKVAARWPQRFAEKAAAYDGPWTESKNITEFMTSQAQLKDCVSTHTHSVSVSIISFLICNYNFVLQISIFLN